jgi:pimeloyl-ACP methyl ester carboxylesterase
LVAGEPIPENLPMKALNPPARAGDHLPPDFHARHAGDVAALLEGLSIPKAAVWGHPDGAVIAAWTAVKAPERVRALILEATHLPALASPRGPGWRRKPVSAAAFRGRVEHPEHLLPARVIQRLQAGHGARWRQVVANWGNAWLALGEREGTCTTGGWPRSGRPAWCCTAATHTRAWVGIQQIGFGCAFA